jgi:lysozyme
MTDLSSLLISFVKDEEGFTPIAKWDYQQWTNGYGTRARYPHEPISRGVAEQRLIAELTFAQAAVDNFNPNLPDGVRRALTDLTFNAGSGWTHAGLGYAVKEGDWETVKVHLLEYDRAGGVINYGLEKRRQAEASWFPSDAQSAK